MKGNEEIIQILGDVLAAELTAINQYFIHSKMTKNWGYNKLASFLKGESIEEMKHADVVIDRILFLEGVPDMQRYMKINVGKTFPEMLKFDLDVELAAVERLNKGIEICTKHHDNASRELLETILIAEEEHIDWIETQQQLINDIGLPNYLAQQI